MLGVARGRGVPAGALVGQPADEFDEFLDGAVRGDGANGLLGAVGLDRRAVQQRHQAADVLDGAGLGRRADHLVRAVGIAGRAGQLGHEPADVVDGAVHRHGPERVDGGSGVVR